MNVSTRARLGAHLVSLALILAAFGLLQGRAEASCALPPQSSNNPFSGTVISVEHNGVTAKVRTEQGREVTVIGGPHGGVHGGSSIDRRYAVGGRYEFHPINNANPFEDNACTATRQLSGPKPPPQGAAADNLPGWLPVDEEAGLLGYALLAGAALALVAAVAAAGLALRSVTRRRRTGVVPSPDS